MERKYLDMINGNKYELLGRMKADCDYYLGAGNKQVNHLWSGSVDQQLEDMRQLLSSIPPQERPDWLTTMDIDRYDREMDHRTVIDEHTLGLHGARFVDLMNGSKARESRKPGEVIFTISRRVYSEDRKKYHFEPNKEHGYMTMTDEMSKIFDTLFTGRPENRSIECIEWEDSWNIVFEDGNYISRKMCRMEKSSFAEWYRTIEKA